MATEITKTNGATMKGKFVKDSPIDLDREVRKCFLDNKIDYLGWF